MCTSLTFVLQGDYDRGYDAGGPNQRSDRGYNDTGYNSGQSRGDGFGALLCLPCIVCIGALFAIVFGIQDLVASGNDTRGQELQQFSIAMKAWTSSGAVAFESLKWLVLAGNGSQTAMQGSKGIITPSNFGESSFNAEHITTPSSLSSYKYTGTAQCPGTAPNQPCTITLKGAKGEVITKQLTPAQQDGPHPMSISSGVCQWYDSDYWHPVPNFPNPNPKFPEP